MRIEGHVYRPAGDRAQLAPRTQHLTRAHQEKVAGLPAQRNRRFQHREKGGLLGDQSQRRQGQQGIKGLTHQRDRISRNIAIRGIV